MKRNHLASVRALLKSKKVHESLRILRALCGPMRYQILVALRASGSAGLTVTELSLVLDASLSRISHQLAILRRHRLVVAKSKNRETMYVLADHHLQKLFSD
jgi:DNA-binding transcriptional ArsR family regulator